MEQRLKTLEDKMDRVLRLLEAREAPRPAVPAATAAVREARDKVAALLREREQAVREPSQKIADRLAKIESQRLTMFLKKKELGERLSQVEKAYKEGGNEAALTVIKAFGIQLKPSDAADDIRKDLIKFKMDRSTVLNTLGPKHPRLKEIDDNIARLEGAIAFAARKAKAADPDDAQPYIDMLKATIAEMDKQIELLTEAFNVESKTARELTARQAAELEPEITRLRKMLDGLDAILRTEK